MNGTGLGCVPNTEGDGKGSQSFFFVSSGHGERTSGNDMPMLPLTDASQTPPSTFGATQGAPVSETSAKSHPAQATEDVRKAPRRASPRRPSSLLCFGLLLAGASVVMGRYAAAQSMPATEPATQALRTITRLYDQQQIVTEISHLSLSPDGLQIAWSQGSDVSGKHRISIAPVGRPQEKRAVAVTQPSELCNEETPEWSPDMRHLALLSDCTSPGQNQIFVLDATDPSSRPKQLTHLSGYLAHLQWAPDGATIAFLYVENASRTPSPMAAENRAVGVIDDLATNQIQRVAITSLEHENTRMATPAGLYIFEFDWSPDGQSLAYTAAPPPGDDNWYIAQLYTQPIDRPEPVCLYRPKLQIALPRWSPDGASVAFIEGLMSDEGATGGEIFSVSRSGGDARNLTPDRASSPSWFQWSSTGDLIFTEFVGGSTAISSLHVADRKTATLWKGGETIQASGATTSLALSRRGGAPQIAFVRTSWSRLPEIWAGPVTALKQLTHENDGVRLPLPHADDVTWTNGGFPVQGWLLFPQDYDPAKEVSHDRQCSRRSGMDCYTKLEKQCVQCHAL